MEVKKKEKKKELVAPRPCTTLSHLVIFLTLKLELRPTDH
jgi:hypothetical protein